MCEYFTLDDCEHVCVRLLIFGDCKCVRVFTEGDCEHTCLRFHHRRP